MSTAIKTCTQINNPESVDNRMHQVDIQDDNFNFDTELKIVQENLKVIAQILERIHFK
jgi:hypothetical protein